MMPHFRYLWYVLKHKAYVFYAGIQLGVSPHQLIIHDYTKFGLTEWFPYVRQFYGEKSTEADERVAFGLGMNIRTRAQIKADFDAAWNHHQKTQPHHWQHWVLITDSDEPRLRALPMPQKYVLEMVADWYGAGMAINLEDGTRYRVQQAIQKAKRVGLVS